MNQIFHDVMSCLPAPPITTNHYYHPHPNIPNADEFRDWGKLPDDLLRSIYSRLTIRDVFHGAWVFAKHWHQLWQGAPLVLDDDYLLMANDDDGHALAANIGRALTTHPGPFVTVRITNVHFQNFGQQLHAWFQLLADKNVRNLVVVNRPWPVDIILPADLLRCEQLESLYIGCFAFPDTTNVSPAFAGLRELGIFYATIAGRDLDAVLDRCKKLQRLSLVRTTQDVSIRSGSLEIVVVWNSRVKTLSVDDAPRLGRLILETPDDVPILPILPIMHIKILQAPELQVLGYLNLDFQVLMISGFTIVPFVTVETTIPRVRSVKTLALKVSFVVESQVASLRSFLICFANLETLHIKRIDEMKPDYVVHNYSDDFWPDLLDAISCLQSHLETVVFEDFRGGSSEMPFAKSMLEHAMVLRVMGVVFHQDCHEFLVHNARNTLLSAHHASADAQVVVYKRNAPSAWRFHNASDLSLIDPFDG